MKRRTTVDQGRLFADSKVGRKVRRVRRGVDATVTALRSTGRLEPSDATLVALARTLADAIDDERMAADSSGFTIAALSGRLHAVETALRGDHAAPADALDDLLAAMAADAQGDGG